MTRAFPPVSISRSVSSLRIYLLADYSGNADEGMKKTALCYQKILAQRHQVTSRDIRTVLHPAFWRELRKDKPHIVHYIPGPTLLSFILMKAIKMSCPGSRAIMSAMHPAFYGFFSLFTPLIRLLKPDLLLVQSTKTEQMFHRLGCNTAYLPSGVDVSRFSPVTAGARRQLKDKYGLSQDKFVVLHIGHLNKTRNIEVLSQLQQGEAQVVIVASTTTRVKDDISRKLKESGCLILTGYQPRVEELYQLADCYVFPTTDKRGSVELPLSVLEAMSCNLPVVTTRFGALPDAIEPGNGIIFAENQAELVKGVESLQNSRTEVRTRDKVLAYSWEKIVAKLEEIYLTLVQ